MEKVKFRESYPLLIPKRYTGDILTRPPAVILKNADNFANCKVQVLRSASQWSAGIDEVESSIHAAMISAIQDSKYFVYIENQFFITSANSSSASEVQNGIGRALFNRVFKAHKNNEAFKVYILLPLLPAFEGQVGSTTGSALRVILHYNYLSMCRGPNSLFQRLENAGVNPEDYISFSSLRTWSDLCGMPVTELIYIHSKLMIVDDRVVICGSANINDRSLLGNRDSEACLLIEDTKFDLVTFKNGQEFSSGHFGGKLRRKLMLEHLGSSIEENVTDCVDDSFFRDTWNKRAESNTRLFEEAFLCSPSDTVTNLEECKIYEDKTPPAEIDGFGAKHLLRGVKGNLVQIPLKFLENENLLPSLTSKEGMVPTMTWT